MSASFSQQNLTVSLDWPKGMLPDTGVEVMSLTRATQLLLGPFSDHRSEDDPVAAYAASEKDAIASHVASKFWIDTVKKTNTLHDFTLTLGNKTTHIYSLRGATSTVLKSIDTSSKLLVDRAIHAAINYLNESVVDRFKDEVNIMTPLARVAITDDMIQSMAEDTDRSPSTIVKCFNIATARKVQQLSSHPNYIPELAMACLIRSSFTQAASQSTKTIGLKQMAKIANTAGVGGIDQSAIALYLSYLSSSETAKTNIEELLNEAKKMKTLGRNRMSHEEIRLLLAIPEDTISEPGTSGQLAASGGTIRKKK